MSDKFKIGFVGLLVVGALVIALTGTALAQEEAPTTPAPKGFGWHGKSPSFGRAMGGQVGLEAAAEALDITADELSTQLWGGKTLADLAEEKGVDLQDVQDAVVAAQEEAMRASIEEAVVDGKLSQENADWLLEGLDKGFLGGRGFGGCHGRGGFRGHGHFGGAPENPENSRFGGFGRFPGRNNAITGTNDA